MLISKIKSRFLECSTQNAIPCYKLNSGHDMPVVAYGTFRSARGEVAKGVQDAINAGYRHFDLAHIYGNEKEVGDVFKSIFDAGTIKREDLFITGKLWNSDHDVEIVPQACDHSLQNLGLTYFDLYLIHFPIGWKFTGLDTPGWGASELSDTSLIDTWRAMESLTDNGKCRSIGVSNYPMILMHDLVTQARIRPAVNQIEVHAYYSRESLVNYCHSRDICVTAHTPLGGGLANTKEYGLGENFAPMIDPTVVKIAEQKSKSPAQVLLRWLLQRNIVVLPKSVKSERIVQNFDVFDFELDASEMEDMNKLDKYVSYKTNPNPLSAFLGGKDCFSQEGTDIFD
eukprot:CAMPEP_0194146676 /NCGR_PEP_ID=MMETSP0152-20130528/21283_1 /TAXON_ID=1049557 /ORGANISM="Thalassiothrix antarctica, Strain L6-D1" /LENGTH=340 /DNA_ID=CAMNT_0038847249 /DNA_START=81 /DNA_END=1103 /DNA_ORIENTATION=+